MSEDKQLIEEDISEEDAALLEDSEKTEAQAEAPPELTLESLAQGVQNAINQIIQGTSGEFDRINAELDKLKRYDGSIETTIESNKKYSVLNRTRLLKLEKLFKEKFSKKKK